MQPFHLIMSCMFLEIGLEIRNQIYIKKATYKRILIFKYYI